MKINRRELITGHNPILTTIATDSPLTVGNGEMAYTADITGMQTLYKEYQEVPLCTMAQWGWHTEPVNDEKYSYTLEDLVMTKYQYQGREVEYPKRKYSGNEDVYDWLRKNPHRLNLARIGLHYKDRDITSSMISSIHQELHLYEGILKSRFLLEGDLCSVTTACDNDGNDTLAFKIKSTAFLKKKLGIKIDFPYGSPKISASDWDSTKRHETNCIFNEDGNILLRRVLDKDIYEVLIKTSGKVTMDLSSHRLFILSDNEELELTVSIGNKLSEKGMETNKVLENSRKGWIRFWEEGGIIRLNKSKEKRALELERRIILSKYLMAVNSSGSTPPQETGLTCNSWYGKMHLEMYLWHCAWLPLWHHTDLLERSLMWYKDHLMEAKENASRNGYKGARWPKMVASEGIDCPSPVAPLLVWQQPHIIYMIEMAYNQNSSNEFLQKYWELIKETAEFMVDFVVWNPTKGCYDICPPVIPVQECHKETESLNPAFEIEYWGFTLDIAIKWAKRLNHKVDEKWIDVAGKMAHLKEQDDVYLAHEECMETFTDFNRDHPSMVGAYGLIDSKRISPDIMKNTLKRVLECWQYETLWGWDFAMMAMTAVRLNEPELAIDILLKDTAKNRYLINGNNKQETRKDLPLYLPGNGSLLLAAAIMTAGYNGCTKETPGFPDDGSWVVEYEGIEPFL